MLRRFHAIGVSINLALKSNVKLVSMRVRNINKQEYLDANKFSGIKETNSMATDKTNTILQINFPNSTDPMKLEIPSFAQQNPMSVRKPKFVTR